jgi:hypothetical protein
MRQKVIADLVKSIEASISDVRYVIDPPDDKFLETGTWFVDISIDTRIFVIEYFGDDKPFGLSEVGGVDSSYGDNAPDHLCSTSEDVVNKLIELINQQ